MLYLPDSQESTFETWRYKYERYGIDGLKESKTWRQYSKELKGQAALEYLSGSVHNEQSFKNTKYLIRAFYETGLNIIIVIEN